MQRVYNKTKKQELFFKKTRMAWEGREGSKSPKLYTTEMMVNEEDCIWQETSANPLSPSHGRPGFM